MNYVVTDSNDNVVCIISDEDERVLLREGLKYFVTDRLVLHETDNGIKAFDATLRLVV